MDANPNFTDTTTPELEQSITSLTANLNAAAFEQLMMIAEFDTRQGWCEEGVRSCAHWLNWRCGVSLNAAREKLRVAHALQNLPKTREAFASGRLSYSKARAITRVGTEDNEECLLSFARYGSASQLEKSVRLYRRQYVGENGEIVTPLEAERQAAMRQRESRLLDTRWDEHGCLEIRARLTPEQGAVVLKALEAAVHSLKDAEAESQLKEPPKIEETYQDLLDGAHTSSAHQHRRADALMLMAGQSLGSNSTITNSDDRYQVVVHVDSQVLAGEAQHFPNGKPDCYIEKEVALSVETARRLSCSCKIVTALTNGSEPLSIGRSARAIPTGMRRALAIRDGRCMFPGCDCNRHLDAHHIQHWSSGGETSLHNLVEVCHYHHVKLHEGGYSVQRLSTGELKFYKPDGSKLSDTPAPMKSDDPLQPGDSEAWFWNGDSMDYDVATYSIANATRVTPL
ncbi:MAG: DUF222 domain-containing protein [Granulosicoccaceae bacterium]